MRPIVLIAILCWTTVVRGEDWAQWRGPGSNAIHEGTGPLEWSREEGVAWREEIPGSGISSPIAWRERIFFTASDGVRQRNLRVVCLSAKSGKQLWSQQLWGTAPTRHHANKSSMASPTPITDGQRLYALFGTGDVFCFDLDGGMLWQRSLASEYGRFENRFAATSSPLLFENLLILQCDHYGDSYVLAIDKLTGVNVWKRDRPETWLSWSSPRLAPAGGGKQELVVCAALKIEGLDPRTGEQLWFADGLRRECIPTPVFGNGLLYAVSGPKGPSMAIRLGGRGDIGQSHVVWRNNRGAPFVPSAILVGSRYYLVDDAGIATCLDAATGKRVWQTRLARGGSGFTASPVAAGKRIYFVDEGGVTHVVDASSASAKVLARNKLEEPVFASPIFVENDLLIRTTSALYRVTGR